MYKVQDRKKTRQRKHASVRLKISGTAQRPRLAVYRSAKHISAQLIDDVNGVTLAAASTLEAPLKEAYGGNKEAAGRVGKSLAERALEKGIKEVVFDRGGMIYHGRVAALAAGAREGGLEF